MLAPNDWQTPFESREYAQTALGLRGNAYSFIERDCRGNPTVLTPLHPGDAQVFKGPNLKPYYSIDGKEPCRCAGATQGSRGHQGAKRHGCADQ